MSAEGGTGRGMSMPSRGASTAVKDGVIHAYRPSSDGERGGDDEDEEDDDEEVEEEDGCECLCVMTGA